MIQRNEYEIDPNVNAESEKNEPTPAIGGLPEEHADDMEDFDMGDEGDDFSDSYGSSTEKYGGYNGYSDDVIDDAFEGDPENTWNVD